MATQRITYDNKTDATPSNAAQWVGPDVNEVKTVVNNNADEIDTAQASAAVADSKATAAQGDIDVRLEQNLGNFAPNTFTFTQSGYYNDYTPTGDVTLDPQGTPTINIWQKVTIISDGTTILTKSPNSVMYNHVSGQNLPQGAYDLWISTVGGKFYYNVQNNDSDVINPSILSFVMAADNTYGDLVLSEGIYGANDGSTPAALADFAVSYTQGGDTATGWTATSVKQNDNTVEGSASNLVGGESTVRVFGTLAGTTNGQGSVSVSPTDGNSLFDQAGNAMDAGESASDTLNTASPIVMQDDFTGSTIDTNKWNVIDPADKVDVVQNNVLRFSGNGGGAAVNGRINNANSLSTFAGGVSTQCMQVDAAISANPDVLQVWFGIWDGTDQEEIVIIADTTDRTKARILVRAGGATNYDFISAVDLANTWKIEIVNTTVKIFYLSAPDTWTQVGATQTEDYTGHTLYPMLAAGTTGADTSGLRVDYDNYYQTNAVYSTSVPS